MTRTIRAGALVFALAVFASTAYAEDIVPDVVGLDAGQAQQLIQAGGYVCDLRYDPSQPGGTVFDQRPGGLAPRPRGSAVTVMVGGSAPGAAPIEPGPIDDGPPTGSLPDVTPIPPGPSVTPVPDDPGLPPTGPSTDDPTPAPGTPGILGLPPARLPSPDGPSIPSVLGERRDVAARALGAWNVIEEQSLGLPDLVGKVINQRPTPGFTMGEGEDVYIVVAIAELPSREHRFVPNLRGKSLQEVRWQLEATGFVAELLTVPSDAAAFGRAVAQRPGPGTVLARGGTVTVHVGRGADDPAPVDPPNDTPIPGPSIDTPEPGPGPSDDMPPAGPVTPIPDQPQPGPVDPPTPPSGSDDPGSPPTGDLPPVPGPSDPPPVTPEDPEPVDPPVDTPEPAPPVEPEPPKIVLPAPTLRSPPKGESYPRAYGATFEWSPVRDATGYEWELQEEQPSSAWETHSTATIDEGTRHRPDRMTRGRYRWRVRAMHDDTPGEWSEWFRLFMY